MTDELSLLAWLVDAVLVLTLVEAAVLLAHHRRTERGLPPREYLANLVSGLCLIGALSLLAHGADTAWVLAAVAAAGIAHAGDLAMRWRRRHATIAVGACAPAGANLS
jgi:hypothetical protein